MRDTVTQSEALRFKLSKLESALTDLKKVGFSLEGELLKVRKQLGIFGVISEDQATAELVVRAAALYYSVKIKDMRGASRKRELVLARQLASYYLHVKMGYTSLFTGTMVSEKTKHHATILHACKNVKGRLEVYDRTDYDPDGFVLGIKAVDEYIEEMNNKLENV